MGELDQKFKKVDVDGVEVEFVLYDTAGQERFRTLTSSYFRNTDAILCVFDLTEQESFDDIEGHIPEGSRFSPQSQKFLVGNKCDLEEERVITEEQAMTMAETFGVSYIETSAKTGHNVDELFLRVGRALIASGGVMKVQGDVKLGEAKGGSSSKKCDC
mmetsp:Transcript_13834/g.54664  ORF Transcript_13834/g.54664 Transcript_13834/m.54664 type:complete len:159 (+) Transcript_13834:110-586(+)